MKAEVYNINGQATSILRHYWGLKKDREKSDKHHAQDAVIIACATNKNQQGQQLHAAIFSPKLKYK